MDDKERIVEDCRIQKVEDKMASIKNSKRSLNSFADEDFYVYNIKSYPLEKNFFLYKEGLIIKIQAVSLDQLKN